MTTTAGDPTSESTAGPTVRGVRIAGTVGA